MKQFQIIYDENKKLDDMFDKLYDNNSIDTIRKNKLELLVELGELANETKCFKYWSNKQPDYDKVIDEYADCMFMILFFFNILDISLEEEFPNIIDKDILDQFTYLFNICSRLKDECNKEIVKDIFANFIYLGKLLGISNEDIINGCLKKINRNKERFKTGF